jgi:hypothetical protein
VSYLVFDVESIAIDGAAEYLENPVPPSNYKSETAIADYIARANTEQMAKAALDVDLARIVAIGWQMSDGNHDVMTCSNDGEETWSLREFWNLVTLGSDRPTLIGFNCIGFDLPLLLRRSLYLGVKAPRLQIGKYRHDGIEDLMLSLSFDGALRYRGLEFWKKRLALNVPPDQHTGANIAGLVADGNWEAVAAHCRSDVQTTVALARRMGVL